MVANIENWLFKFGDDCHWCEPEINNDGSITCTKCSLTDCPFWTDYHEVKNERKNSNIKKS